MYNVHIHSYIHINIYKRGMHLVLTVMKDIVYMFAMSTHPRLASRYNTLENVVVKDSVHIGHVDKCLHPNKIVQGATLY